MVILCHIGDLHPVGQLPVGLVGDQKDGDAQLLFLLFQDSGQGLYGILAIHHSCGIIGVIDDDGLGPFCDLLLKLIQLWHKGLCIRGDPHHLSVIIPHIAVVLHKVRGEYDHLVSRV